jgi:hypothetical protein
MIPFDGFSWARGGDGSDTKDRLVLVPKVGVEKIGGEAGVFRHRDAVSAREPAEQGPWLGIAGWHRCLENEGMTASIAADAVDKGVEHGATQTGSLCRRRDGDLPHEQDLRPRGRVVSRHESLQFTVTIRDDRCGSKIRRQQQIRICRIQIKHTGGSDELMHANRIWALRTTQIWPPARTSAAQLTSIRNVL